MTADPWEDEGFGGEDDWASDESIETDVEDEDDLDLEDVDETELDEAS
jgi:hypothetical protein